MSELALTKTGYKFNFDSDEPVQGEVFDADKVERQEKFIRWAIPTAIAWNVIIFGIIAAKWWYLGGYMWMHYALAKWSGGFYMTLIGAKPGYYLLGF